MTERTEHLAQRLIDRVSRAVETYAETPAHEGVAAGILLVGYARQGYLKADTAAGNHILFCVTKDGNQATGLLYSVLREAKAGYLQADTAAIHEKFRKRGKS